MIKILDKNSRKTKFFNNLEEGDTFRITSDFLYGYDKDNLYMKTCLGFVCIHGKDVGNTWSGVYDDYRIKEVELEATEV